MVMFFGQSNCYLRPDTVNNQLIRLAVKESKIKWVVNILFARLLCISVL